MVRAGFERDESSRAAYGVATQAGIAQGHNLRVGLAGGLSVPFAQNFAVRADQHAAHARIGFAQADGLFRESQRSPHPALICF